MRHQKVTSSFLSRTTNWTLSTNSGTELQKQETTEVLPRKFNWKKIQPRILRKRTLKKTWNLWTLKIFVKTKKKKRKILKFKELCFPDTLSDKFPANYTKIYTTLSFLSISFSFLCIKILLKNFIVCGIFSNQYPN